MKRLNLPRLPEVREEFLALAERLGVTRGERRRRKHKPHPPHPWHKKQPEAREKAWKKLEGMARRGDGSALKTLRTAPRKRARDLAAEIEGKR